MLQADKVISLGSSVFLTAGYYALNKELMPTKGLYAQLGGMAAASLFHAYYPDNCEQIREKIGENWDYAVQWLYPGMIFVAGYLGGASLEINLLATAMFSYTHLVMGMISWDMADRRKEDQAEVLTKDIGKNIDDNRLETAGTAIDQANALRKKLVSPNSHSYKMSQIDRSAVKLSSAYLYLSTPNVEKAEEWARKIVEPLQKFSALKTLARHLLNGDKSEKTGEKIEELIAECGDQGPQFFSLRYDFAMKYEKPELTSKVKEELEALGETLSDISTIMKLAKHSVIHKDNEFAKACIKLVEDRLEKFKTPNRYAFYSKIVRLDKEPEPFARSRYISHRPEEIPGLIVSDLAYLALKIGEEETALRLVDSKHLTRIEDHLAVHMEMAREKRPSSIDESRAFIAKATDLIDGYTLTADVADRDISIAKFQRNAYRSVVLFQMKFDLEGAYISAKKAQDGDTDKLGKGKGNLLLTLAGEAETKNPQLARRIAADLDASFHKLTYQERISLMKLQRKVDSETLVSSYGEHTAVWAQGSPVEKAQALQVIGNYYFSRGLYNSAQGILEEIQAFEVDADVYGSLASKLQRVTVRFWHG